MLIDCDTCRAPAAACGDCVMTVLLQLESRPVELDREEFGALGALASAGLVPPLRLVVGVASPDGSQLTGQDELVEQDEMPEYPAGRSGGRPASTRARRGIA